MIMRTPHLTTGYDPTLTAQIAKTRPGMAHWAASGPLGRTCAECAYLGYQQQVQNAIGVVVATKQRYGCAKFLALTGRHGAIVPQSTEACRHFELRSEHKGRFQKVMKPAPASRSAGKRFDADADADATTLSPEAGHAS